MPRYKGRESPRGLSEIFPLSSKWPSRRAASAERWTLYLISMSSVALRRAAAVAGGKRTEIISAGVLPMPPRPTPFSYGSVAL